MYVCLCHGVSDRMIKELLDSGVESVPEIQKRCQAGRNCGACVCQLKELVETKKAPTS